MLNPNLAPLTERLQVLRAKLGVAGVVDGGVCSRGTESSALAVERRRWRGSGRRWRFGFPRFGQPLRGCCAFPRDFVRMNRWAGPIPSPDFLQRRNSYG